MGIFSGLITPIQYQAQNALSDFWYQPVGQESVTGIRVDADTASAYSAVWACVRAIADNLASVPLPIYRRLPDGGRERARDYYLYDVFATAPNRFQTPIEFRSMMTRHVLLRGNAYAHIVAGRRGFASQLIPLHPDRMKVEQLDDGGLRYRYRKGVQEIIYNDDEIFHLRGISEDGITGMSVLRYARESIGLGLATESYGARLFNQGARPGGILKHPGKLSDEAKKRLALSWQEAHGGLGKAHGTAVLEEGLEWQAVGMTNEDAQFLASREFQISEIARWFGVPLFMIQETSKVTSWGTGIAHLGLAFDTYTLLPWSIRWDQTITRDLIVETGTYYAEHLFDSLKRVDIKTRYEAYGMARQWGWFSVNDIRRRENDNPVENGDIYLQASNMIEAGAPPPPQQPPPPAPQPEPIPASREAVRNEAHYWSLLRENATQVIRKEVSALSKTAKRLADNTSAWQAAIEEFYGEHVGFVSQKMCCGQHDAEAYVLQQRETLLRQGAAVLELWGEQEIQRLMDLAVRNNDAGGLVDK